MSDHVMSGPIEVAAPGRQPHFAVTEPGQWLLLLLALRDARHPLDPVRVQAGLFLLSQEGGLPTPQTYAFEPLDHGPFSAAIVEDLQQLADTGLVSGEPAEGYRWSRYRISADGLRAAQSLVDSLDEPALMSLRTLASIKEQVTSESVSGLLAHLRREHPSLSRNSIFG